MDQSPQQASLTFKRLKGVSAPGQLDDILSDQKLSIGIITNPLSRGNRNQSNSLYNVIRNRKNVYHYSTPNIAAVAKTLEKLASRTIKILVVNGGDGTVQHVLTALFNNNFFKTQPFLALLRSGTTNMTAGDVGLHGSKVQAMQRLLSWSMTGKGNPRILNRPVVCLKGPAHRKPICGMFFGTAAIYQGIHFCKQKIHKIGLRGEIGPGLTLLFFVLAILRKQSHLVTPSSMKINLDGRQLNRHQYTIVLISTLERLFLGLRPYWGKHQAPLHFTAMRANSKCLLRVLPSALRGYQNRLGTPDNGYISQNIHTAHLSSPCGYTLDGELFEMDPQNGTVRVENAGEVSFLQI